MPQLWARALQFLGAVAAVAAASLITNAIYDWLQPSISLLFFPAIVLTAVYGGYVPALLATLLSTISLAYFFVPPRHSFDIGLDDVLRLSVFMIVACATAWLSTARRRAEEEQRRSMNELRAAVATLQRVSDWPVLGGLDLATGVRRMLDHAALVVAAGDVFILWESDDEPWIYLASAKGPDGVASHAPTELVPLVAEALEHTAFVAPDPASLQVVTRRPGDAAEWRGQALHPALAARLPPGPMATAPFRTDHVAGRAFFTGLQNGGPSVLPSVEVVAREIGNSLEQLSVEEQARELAVREDRLHVSRDLHDGVLQALTGIRLKIQAIASATGSASEVQNQLLAIERALAIEQRELRLFIDQLKPGAGVPTECGPIAQRFHDMGARLSAEWHTPIQVAVSPADLSVPRAREQSLRLMVHEAIVNALKHAHPSRVVVAIDGGDRELAVVVADDGPGFAFTGRLEQDALVARQVGPASLRDRVMAMGGRIAVESSPSGSRVEFAIPAGGDPSGS